jgi:type VI secretion system protein VasD
MRRRPLLIAAGLLPLTACGPKPPPPTVIGMTLTATPDANRNGAGAVTPLRVRVLRLASDTTFLQSDFFALDGNPQRALGKDLVGFDDLVLAPGATVPFEREAEPDARLVAVMGAYYAIDRAQWRATRPLRKNVVNLLTARFSPSGVTLEETGA